MKIRINGNSVRIRLSRSEVDRFGKEGLLQESTDFGNGSLLYSMQSKKDINGLEASFSDSKITMYVPANVISEWVSTEKVGFDNYMDIGNGKQLFLLLEKDFKCIDNSMEDQSDNFENPHKTC
jgi:hypothetical protein